MRKIISVVLSFGLLFQQSGLLYAAGEINLANYLSQARNAIVQPEVFQPPRLRYISYDVANNDFKILLDKGNNVNRKTEKPKNEKTLEFLNSLTPKLLNSKTPELNESTQELFNYFLTGLALPNDTFWVNLRPDAPENIIDPLLEKTDIGKIFLEADLQLKKDTASLTSPQNPEGKSYWDKLYKKAGELFGTENITIPTITRPWIVPNEVIVRETEDSAYIYKATLKVMLEADYLTGRGGSRTAPTPDQYAFSDPRLKELNEYSSQIIRETIIPKLTKEVNSSKRYAKLRQVYYSLVLSRWFKQKYQGLPVGNGLKPFPTLDSGDLTNLTSQQPCDKQDYFQAYQKSFKNGEYNLKETVATPFGQSIRSYISGGITAKMDIGKFHVGANSKKVDDVLTSGSPIFNLWGLFNKKKETKNPINILYSGYRKSKDRDEPDVVADRMLNVIFHFNGEIDKKDIQKIIELLGKAEKVKPYFYESILAIFNEAVTNWDYESSIVEVRNKIRIALDAFVIDKGGEIIRFINDFLSRNKNKEDGLVQELQEFNNKKERSYDYYVAIASLLHHKRHHLERASEFHKGIAGRKLHNFMGEISLLQGFDVKKYDEIVLSELTKISPIVDDVIIVDFILNYSKLFASGSPLTLDQFESVLTQFGVNTSEFSKKDKFYELINKMSLVAKKDKEFECEIFDKIFYVLRDQIEIHHTAGYVLLTLKGLHRDMFNYDAEEYPTIVKVTEAIYRGLTMSYDALSKSQGEGGVENLKIIEQFLAAVRPVLLDAGVESLKKQPKYQDKLRESIREICRHETAILLKQAEEGYVKIISDEIRGYISKDRIIDAVDALAQAFGETRGYNEQVRYCQKIKEAREISSAGSPLSAEDFKAKLEENLKQEKITFVGLLELFSEVDKNAQLDSSIASLIADVLEKFARQEDPQESQGLIHVRSAILKSAGGIFYFFRSYDKQSTFRILDILEETRRALKEKRLYIEMMYVRGSVWMEVVKEIVKDTDDALMAVEKARKKIDGQGKSFSGSPLVGKELVVYDQNGKAIEYLRFVSYDKDIKGKNRLMLKDIMDRLNTTALLSDSGRPMYQFTLDSFNLSGMYFAVELDDSGKVVELKGILRIVNRKIETLGGKNQEVINALKNKEKEIVSSAVVSEEGVSENRWGGIDLTDRALQIKLERVGSFASSSLVLPQVQGAEGIDLDREFEQIEALALNGFNPNSRRILELFTVCHSRGEFRERLNQIISCLKSSSAIQEVQAIDSDEDFRLALMMPEMLS